MLLELKFGYCSWRRYLTNPSSLWRHGAQLNMDSEERKREHIIYSCWNNSALSLADCSPSLYCWCSEFLMGWALAVPIRVGMRPFWLLGINSKVGRNTLNLKLMPHSPLIPAQDLSFGVCFGMRAASCVKAGTELWTLLIRWWGKVGRWESRARVQLTELQTNWAALKQRRCLYGVVGEPSEGLPAWKIFSAHLPGCQYYGLRCSSAHLVISPPTHSFTYLSAILLLRAYCVLDPALVRDGVVDEEGVFLLREFIFIVQFGGFYDSCTESYGSTWRTNKILQIKLSRI